ncbi:MAG: hypothetical protein U0166_11135 [Acidobacteriota bacterium]
MTPRPFIATRGYDLGWFFGGTIASLAALALIAAGIPIVAVFWVWLLAFDGPHIAAAFTRTYLDREMWRTRPRLLSGSLLAFAVGPAALLLSLASRSEAPFLLYLAASAFYGYYHVVRQHYGFLALYKAVNGDRGGYLLDRWCLYIGCWTPYFAFLLLHPRARALLHLPARNLALAESAGVALLAAAFLASLGVLARNAVARPSPPALYALLTVLLYGAVYGLVSRLEPVYAASSGPDQDFLLMSVMVTIFHNVQYLGLVFFHNRNRFGDRDQHGAASWLAASVPRYLAACALFSIVYLAFACSTGVFPGCQLLPRARLGAITMGQIGLCLWWGLAIHHYYLDQKIWRVRTDPDLRSALGLAG